MLIGRLFSDGQRVFSAPLRLVWLRVPERGKSPVQVLFGVPATRFRRAVDRNRIRRQMREVWRLQKAVLYSCLNDQTDGLSVALLFTGTRIPDYAGLQRSMVVVLQKLIHELNSPYPDGEQGRGRVDDVVDPVLPGGD